MMTNRRNFLTQAGMAAAGTMMLRAADSWGATAPPAAGATTPNIVYILADDMGFADIGCFGSMISTPNLDALAASGLRFTQFYNTARCCPTRASLLTGLYPHQAGVGYMTNDKGEAAPGYRGRLNDRCVTIPEVLREAGYFTFMTGKWHLGQNAGCAPWTRGFERSLNAAAGGFYFPGSPKATLFLDGKNVGQRGGVLPQDWYSTDLWVEFGLKFMDEALAKRKPFFYYLAHNAPHFPLQAPAEDIARWRGKFKKGWDVLREECYQRQVEMGLTDRRWLLSPRPKDVKPWDSLTAEEKDRFDHINAIYAAVIERLDRSVGTLVAGLKQRGIFDNTLIVFVSDNGACAESGPNGKFIGEQPGGPDSSVFLGQSWATLSDTPFRRYKHFTHEGGIAAPFIAHWPKGIPAARNGGFEKQPAHLVDLMATAVDLAGASYPAARNGQAIQPMEGVSLRPAFEGKALDRPRPLFWEHEGNRAIRDGKWKLVSKHTEPWELYDIEADRTELRDLSAQMPEKVRELAARWETMARDRMVEPWVGPKRLDSGNPPPAGAGGKAKAKGKGKPPTGEEDEE